MPPTHYDFRIQTHVRARYQRDRQDQQGNQHTEYLLKSALNQKLETRGAQYHIYIKTLLTLGRGGGGRG